MPSPKHRSSKLRKLFVKTASRIKVHYSRRKPKISRCPECGNILKGIVRARATKLKVFSKTEKTPSRKFTNLCSQCSRKKLIERARNIKW